MVVLRCLCVLTLLLTATSAATQVSTDKTPAFVTVCEVLANRESYNGKVVALIGRWSATDEGFWLVDDCDRQVKTDDYVWANIISLKYDPSSESILSNGAKPDRIAAEKKIAQLKTRSKPSKNKVDWAVVYGRIET